MKRLFLVIFFFGLSGLFLYLFLHGNLQSTPVIDSDFEKGTTHAYVSQTDHGKVLIGKKDENGEVKSEVTFQKWDGEAEMAISYPTSDTSPTVNGSTVTWKDDNQEVYLKKIEPGETSTPTPTRVIDNGTIRWIDYGKTNLRTLAAAYELPQVNQSRMPTLSTFQVHEDGFAFIGDRPASTDLKDVENIKLPIVRLKSENDFTCPVVPANKDKSVLLMYYEPNLGNKKSEIMDKFVQAINSTVEKKGITGKVIRAADSLLIRDGLRPKSLGRIAVDKNTLIFYLYLESPYTDEIKTHMRAARILQDTSLVPYTGLRSFNKSIDLSIINDIAQEFSSQSKQTLSNTPLSDKETLSLTDIIKNGKAKGWNIEAVRTDNDHDNFDKFEFDILLHEKPESNTFTYNIDTNDLDFHYQAPLTEEEKEKGIMRPENIVGSYAVYYSKVEQPIYTTQEEADKYKSGKAFHIYRPKAIDAKGDWTWGELHIDTDTGKMEVSFDKNWLDKAVYPVTVDPTIGNTNVGGSTVSNGTLKGIKSSFLEDVTITSVSFYAQFKNTPINYMAGLYTIGGEQLGTSASTPSTDMTASWRTLTLSAPVDVRPGQYGAFYGDQETFNVTAYYDTGIAGGLDSNSFMSDGHIPSQIEISDSAKYYSVYATYRTITPPQLPLPHSPIELGITKAKDDGGMTLMSLGNVFGYTDTYYFLFRKVYLPSNAVITNAYLEFLSSDPNEFTSIKLNIYGGKLLNPDVIQNKNTIPLTTTFASWSVQTIPDETRFATSDISDVLEEIVSQEGWVPFNNVIFLIKPDTSTPRNNWVNVYGFASGADKSARLHIEFTSPDVVEGNYFKGNMNIGPGTSISTQ